MKYLLSSIFLIAMGALYAQELTISNRYSTTLNVSCTERHTYYRVGRKYYIIGRSKVSWYDAAHLCRRFGGDLLLIQNDDEFKTLSSYLKGQGYGADDWFWTSGNDLITNDLFMSINNGLPLPFTSWSAGQPDVPTEDCVHLWLREGEFLMNNWFCDQKAYYICERQNNTRCYGI